MQEVSKWKAKHMLSHSSKIASPMLMLPSNGKTNAEKRMISPSGKLIVIIQHTLSWKSKQENLTDGSPLNNLDFNRATLAPSSWIH
jgi:hypothetical protein